MQFIRPVLLKILTYVFRATVIDHLEQTSAGHLAYFYFDFRSSEKRAAEVMLRSIAAQLERSSYPTQLSSGLKDLYTTCCGGSRRQPTIAETIHLIKLASMSTQNAFVVLDALDECSERRTLLQVLSALKSSAPQLRIFVASRQEQDILEGLTADCFRPITIATDATKLDIAQFVRSALSQDPHLCKLPEDLKSDVLKALIEGANSM